MPENSEMWPSLFAIAAGIGLSASAGFRVFVPLLVFGLASKFGMGDQIPLGQDFEWLASWPAILIFGTATVVEIVAYYVPWVDNLLDSVATPAALISGTVMTAAVLPEMPDALHWTLAAIMGGGSAGMVQAGTVLTRATSTATSGGLANPAVSTVETGGSLLTSILALIIPLMLAAILLCVFVFIGSKLIKRFFQKKRQAAAS